MIITWFGQANFKIQGQNSTVVTDPFDKSFGLKMPRLASDIVTVSHDHKDHNNYKAVRGVTNDKPFIIENSGEYEVKNVFIQGIPSWHDNKEGAERGPNIIYRIDIDGVSITHLGDLGHVLANGQTGKLEGTDILMIPVGGTYTINAKQATEIIAQLEPRIVIPMHYNLKGLKIPKKIDPVSTFCKEFGACPTEELNKFKITKKDLPSGELKVVIMQP